MAEQYVRQYAEFRGVDFSSDPLNINDSRVAYAVNMWRDYQNGNGDMIETIPGFRCFSGDYPIYGGTFPGYRTNINGMHYYRTTDKEGQIKDYLIVHVYTSLFYKEHLAEGSFLELPSDGNTTFMKDAKSSSVMVNNMLYIIDGANFISISPSSDGLEAFILKTTTYGGVTKGIKRYEPTVFKDGSPYEQPNILSGYAYEVFNNKDMEDVVEGVNGEKTYISYIVRGLKTVDFVKLGVEDVTQGSQDGSGLWYSFNEKTGELRLYNKNKDDVRNIVLKLEGEVNNITFQRADVYPSFALENENICGEEAILGCTSIAVFDGKVFLTGNPKFPNTVFFSSSDITGRNNPTYFGVFNWLDTGIGMTPNISMTASSGVLMVYKGDTVHDGSVYYLAPFNTSFGEDWMTNLIPRYYTVTEGVAGIGCIGGTFNFMDDPVFISRRGLDAIGKQMTNLERSIVHRSTNVDRRLLAEDLAQARMAQWQGYLVIAVGGNLYLADSRAMYADALGNTQYEWFYVEGIGSYDEITHRFRYWQGDIDALKKVYDSYMTDSEDTDGNTMQNWSVNHDKADEICYAKNIAWDSFTVNGETVKQYYSIEDETHTDLVGLESEETKWYLLYEDEEAIPKANATFYPLKEMVVIDDVLYFGTDDGRVYVFNTDKRGEIPDSIYRDGKWVDNEYHDESEFVGVIPQEYYTFGGRKYISGIITKTDNAGVGYATKDTVNRSLVLRCGADPRTHSTVVVEVLTDRNSTFKEVDRKDTSVNTYAMADFSSATFNTYPFAFLTFREHERKWIEKKYKIYNDSYRGILRIHSLSYRYQIGGKIK